MPIVLPILPDPDSEETAPYCVIAKHRAKPGLADAYERRMLADLERTRDEPGALQFHIHRDRFDRNLFVIYEVWRDVNSLQAHFEKPYVKQFVADSAQYIEGNMEVQWLVMASKYAPGRRSIVVNQSSTKGESHMSTKNKEIVEKVNASFAEGGFEAFLSFCADDVVWTIAGDKTAKGKNAIREWMASMDIEPPKFTVANIIGEGDFVTAYGEMAMKDKDGKTAPYAYCDIYRFRNGKIAELLSFVVKTEAKAEKASGA